MRGALAVERGGEGFGLDEEARLAEDEERVVDRVVTGLGAVLAAHVLEFVDVPAEGSEQGVDEDRLGLLLAQVITVGAQLGDAGADPGQSLAKACL